MKAAVFHANGGPEVLRIEEIPDSRPGPGHVRIRVKAAALNHLDLFVRRGLPIQLALPHIGGAVMAGEVDVVADDVTAWSPGERVVVNPSLGCGRCDACLLGDEPLCPDFRIIGEHVHGGFAEYAVVLAANLYQVPESCSWERAAAAPLTFQTAWRGLVNRGRLRAGDTVLVTGASGGVATAAIAIARHIGAVVYAITSSDYVDRVRALGVAEVFDRNQPDHRREMWDRTGRRGVDVVFDAVGQATWMDNVRALGRGGRMVVYGATSGPHASTDVRYLFWKQIDVLGTTMANRREFEAVMDLVFRGALEPVIDVVWPLERIRAAHERLERGEQFGKIVVVP